MALSVVSLAGSEKIDSTSLSLFPTRQIWTLALNSQITVPPAYDADRVFFALDGDRLVAYEFESGKQLWLVPARPQKQPVAGDDMVFTVEPGEIVARRIADGSVAWSRPLTGEASAAPMWASGWLVVVTEAGAAMMYRATDGHLIWTHELGSPATAPSAMAGDRIYIPTADARVVALLVETGAPVWERRLGGPPHDILVIDDRLYTGSKDNFLYCILTRTGVVDWRWRTGGDVIGLPAVDDDRIYFVSLDNVLRSLNRVSGAQQWMRPLPVRPVWGPVKVRDRLVVGGQATKLHAFHMKDGATGGTIEAGADVAAIPHIVRDAEALLPVMHIVTRDLAKGAAARLVTRRLEPESNALTDPLPNVIKMGGGEKKP
jgi:outer membrane protein assembly factor BamB